MPLRTLYEELQTADSRYSPPISLEFSDPDTLCLSTSPLNTCILRYQSILRNLDAHLVVLSLRPSLIDDAAALLAAVRARLASTDEHIRTVYIQQFINPRKSATFFCSPSLF